MSCSFLVYRCFVIVDRRKIVFSFRSRIRYSEIDENGYLSLPALLNYFQDCCTFHSEAIGQGMKIVSERKRAWMLSGWQIVIERYPDFGEEIIISTAPYEFKGFMGNRNFLLETLEGERVAWANTFWTHINLETGRPEKLTDEDVRGYDLERRIEMDYAPRKISVPKEGILMESYPVQRHHLDTNHHVNNVQYVCMAEEYLPEKVYIRQMRAEYKMQAKLHDVIYPKIFREDDKLTVQLNNEKGIPYAVVEFLINTTTTSI